MYKLIDENDSEYLSNRKGSLGGHKHLKIYGLLSCPSALSFISKGHYIEQRVFFLDKKTAVSAGYRPCARCMPTEYRKWKNSSYR
jgi:methylphosphotriester-DNA--protein-cysteine methyltransferase